MAKTNNTATIESLRNFALTRNEIAFAHLCTAALNGEEWAIERVARAFRIISRRSEMIGTGDPMQDVSSDEVTLEVIREADTTRPDGGTSRGLVEV